MQRLNGLARWGSRTAARLGLLALAGGLLAGCAGAPHAPATTGTQSTGEIIAFEGARIIVGDGNAPLEDAVLLVQGSKVLQVGPRGQVSVPGNAQRVNLSGKTVMPALIDTHLHTNQGMQLLSQDLRRLAYFGVGSAMSLGVDTDDAILQARATPLPGAARILTAGRGITAPEPGRETAPIWVTTEAQARQAVRDNVRRQVDIIKLWVDDRGGKYQPLSPPLYTAIIDEAHKNGLRVSAHIYALQDAKALLNAGVDAFAHSIRDHEVDENFLAMLKHHPRLVLNPNLPYRGVATDLSWLEGVLPAEQFQQVQAANVDRPQAREAFELQARNMIKMREHGVLLVMGTDTSFDFPNGNTPWASHIELEDMVLGGLQPMQALLSATRDAARFMKLEDAGTLESGKSADFLVLQGDPLQDITNTRRIDAVYLRGSEVDRSVYP